MPKSVCIDIFMATFEDLDTDKQLDMCIDACTHMCMDMRVPNGDLATGACAAGQSDHARVVGCGCDSSEGRYWPKKYSNSCCVIVCHRLVRHQRILELVERSISASPTAHTY